jgi:hypothetical protein
MADGPPVKGRGALVGFILLLLVLAAAMLTIPQVDYPWTLAIAHHRIKWFSDIMGRTLFEGHWPGGPDAGNLFLILSALLYLLAWVKPLRGRLCRLRPYLGFIVCTGLICSVFMVHGLKWGVGRARPNQVISRGLPYSQFYQFGAQYLTGGAYRSSFPSGHTACVFTLMTLAYILALGPGRASAMRLAGISWGVLALTYSVLMAVARSMSMSHWIGDGLLAILMSWPILHALYFWVLRVPEQTGEGDGDGISARMPLLWELRICWWLWWITVGLEATVMGGRAFDRHVPWLGLLIPAGLLVMGWAGRRLHRFYGRVRAVFQTRSSPARRAS